MKTKIMYCYKCHKDTVHRLVDKNGYCDGLGIARGMFAVMSLGISEMYKDKYYQCEKCGEIEKKIW